MCCGAKTDGRVSSAKRSALQCGRAANVRTYNRQAKTPRITGAVFHSRCQMFARLVAVPVVEGDIAQALAIELHAAGQCGNTGGAFHRPLNLLGIERP